MTEQDAVNLEIERRSCLVTIAQLSRGDGYMETSVAKIIDKLRAKVKEIEEKLKNR